MNINFNAKTIELTTAEMREASKYGSQAYRDLMDARRDNPGYRTVEKKVKRTKSVFDNLTMADIRAYVKEHGTPEQKKQFLTISTAYVTDDGIYHAAQSFFEIKKWFLAEFPQYKESMEQHNAEIIRIFEAVDAKIAAAAQKAAEEARAKAAAEAKDFMESA